MRLWRGSFSSPTFYPLSPGEAMEKWKEWGFKRVHIVDLEGAREGFPVHREIIKNLRENFEGVIQVGGGIRDEETVRIYLEEIGVDKVVLGSRAGDLAFLENVSRKFPHRLIVSLDIKEGYIYTHGWEKKEGITLEEGMKKISSFPLESIIITDISRDGTLEGLDVNGLKKFLPSSPFPLILAGGVSSAGDLERVERELPFIKGVILGKALYEGRIKRREIEKWLNH